MDRWEDLVWPAEDFSRIPYAVFTSEDVHDREQEGIFRGPVWLYLGLEAEIPNPGDFITTYAGDTHVVLDRALDGSLHAFVNRCAHRGSTVVRELFGNRDSHTCVYHHWRYDLTGQLIGVPFQKGVAGKGGMPPSFDKSQHGLKTLKVASYQGVVFGAFDPDAESLEEFLGKPALEFLDRMFGKPIEILGYMRQRMPSNWKLYWENFVDAYHGGMLHQIPVVFGLHRNTQQTKLMLDKLGRHMAAYVVYDSDTEEEVHEGYDDTVLFDETLRLEDPSLVGYRDEVGDGHVVRMMTVFPSIMFHQLSNTLATRQIRPKRAGEFELYWTYFGYVDDDPELRELRVQRQLGLSGPAGFIDMEDGESGVLIQKALTREGGEHSVVEMGGIGPIGDQDHQMTEVCVRAFWRYYAHIMGYRVDGAPPWPPPM